MELGPDSGPHLSLYAYGPTISFENFRKSVGIGLSRNVGCVERSVIISVTKKSKSFNEMLIY